MKRQTTEVDRNAKAHLLFVKNIENDTFFLSY